MTVWADHFETLVTVAPVRVEAGGYGGQSLVLVSSQGRVLCRIGTDRAAERALAEAMAASINVFVKAAAGAA